MTFLPLKIFDENVPDGDDVADGAGKDKEMEYGVHISLIIKGIEYGSCDVADTLGNNPNNSGCTDCVEQRFEGY